MGLAPKRLRVHPNFGSDPRLAEWVLFSETPAKPTHSTSLALARPQSRLCTSKLETTFHDVLSGSNCRSLATQCLERIRVDDHKLRLQRKLSRNSAACLGCSHCLLTGADAQLSALSKCRARAEHIVRKLHSENYAELTRLNTRVSRFDKVQKATAQTRRKQQAELARQQRYLEIIQICQKNQNLHAFFARVDCP